MIFDLLSWSDEKSKITTEPRDKSRSTEGGPLPLEPLQLRSTGRGRGTIKINW